jgi:hypothetical protein
MPRRELLKHLKALLETLQMSDISTPEQDEALETVIIDLTLAKKRGKGVR